MSKTPNQKFLCFVHPITRSSDHPIPYAHLVSKKKM